MFRSIRPTDLVALIFSRGRLLPNEAKTRQNLDKRGRETLPIRTFFTQWFPLARKRHIWVCAQQGQLQGLVSSRSRSGGNAWEIDHLLLSRDDENACLELLEGLNSFGSKLGIEKLFLRLPSDSPLLDLARRAGFSSYLTEFLYRFEGRETVELIPSPPLRPKSKHDEYELFQLYNLAAPAPVRSAEGMTFQEWRDSRDEGLEIELVYEKGDRLVAWLRATREGETGYFEVVIPPPEEDILDHLVKYSLALLNDRPLIFCLAPEFQPRLRRLLLEQNFEEVAQYSTLVKQLTVRLRQPKVMPVRA